MIFITILSIFHCVMVIGARDDTGTPVLVEKAEVEAEDDDGAEAQADG